MRVTNAPASRKRRTRMIRAAKGFRGGPQDQSLCEGMRHGRWRTEDHAAA